MHDEMKDALRGGDVQSPEKAAHLECVRVQRRRRTVARHPMRTLAAERRAFVPTAAGWSAALSEDIRRAVDARLRAMGWS